MEKSNLKKIMGMIIFMLVVLSFIDGCKFYTRTENSIEAKNIERLESEYGKESKFGLVNRKKINNSLIYIYSVSSKGADNEYSCFIYSKSRFIDLYSLDVFKNNIFKEMNSIKTLAKNSYKTNYITINKDSSDIEIIEENCE